MLEQKRRFIVLAFVMVILVGAISMLSTWILYQTALDEQKKRLYELVQSQASLALEVGYLSDELNLAREGEIDREMALNRLARAHKRFQIESKSGEFTVGSHRGSNIVFLIVNGQRVPASSPFSTIPLTSPLATPIKQALFGKSGTLIGKDYKGKEVLAAYTPLFLQRKVLGIVAKIDLEEIRAPFFRANFIISGMGLVFTLIGLTFFFKISEPILQDIRLSEKNYRDLVEGSNSLILRIDHKGIITFANLFSRDFLACSNKELTGLNAGPILACNTEIQADFTSIDEALNYFGEGNGPHEISVIREDGQKSWVSWTVKKIVNKEGSTSELLCIGNDITAKFLANEARKEIEERFQGIAKASPVGIIITDLEGNQLYANERMHELTGMDTTETAGQGWFRRIHPDNRASLQSNWYSGRAITTDRMEFRIFDKDNNEIWVFGQIVDLKSSTGDKVGYVATLTDITQIKEAEVEHKRLTAAIDQAAESIMITDLDGIITYVNPGFERITGYSRKEIIGQNPRVLSSGEHDTDFYKDLWETITTGRIWSGRFINQQKDGQRYTQETTIGPIRDENDVTFSYVCVGRDISDQLIVEAQLRQAQKLESIGELAAGIAHEINTPTQYVSTNTQFLEESFATLMGMLERSNQLVKGVQSKQTHDELLLLADIAIDEKELKYLSEDVPVAIAESETGLKRIAEIVQSVKQLAHPGEISKNYHSLNDIIKNAVTVSSNEWKYVAGIDLDLEKNLPEIHCLKGEVGQVVLNLIINSAHAIEAKIGTNSEEKGRITIQTYQDGEWGIFKVTDTGSGMPKEVVERAFDPFFTTKEVGKGTGQGLAITHNVIVNMHGGSIDVETEEGAGTTFIIALPFKEA